MSSIKDTPFPFIVFATITEGLFFLNGALESNLGNIKVSVTLPEWQQVITQKDWLAQPLTGQLSGQMKDLSLLEKFIPTLQKPRGQLQLQAELQGRLNAPQVKLNAELSQGSVLFIPYNLTLRNIHVQLSGWLHQSLKLWGSAKAKEGFLTCEGTLSEIFSQPKIVLKLTGKDILAADLPSYQIWVTPQLMFSSQEDQMNLSGNILIPKARLNFVDYGKTIIGLTPDVVYVGEETSSVNFSSRLALTLGDDIQFRYGGLKGLLKGALQLQQLPHNAATAKGSIHLSQGTYQAYGQTLIMQKGVASYIGGNVDNPTLNIRAVKTIKNAIPLNPDGSIMQGLPWAGPDNVLTVGVMVTGPLLQRKVTLFSEPAGLAQSDILSYLILGVPTAQAGSAQGQLLLSAASALGDGSGSNKITELENQIRNIF